MLKKQKNSDEKTESKVELTQEQILENQIKRLNQLVNESVNKVEQSKAELNQYIGALDFAKAQLTEIKSKK